MSDALELMRAAHKRSKDNMEKHDACTPEGHASLIEASAQSHTDSEIIYYSLENMPEQVSKQVLKKLNGQAESFRKPAPINSRKDETKIKWKDLEVTTHNVEVANAGLEIIPQVFQ